MRKSKNQQLMPPADLAVIALGGIALCSEAILNRFGWKLPRRLPDVKAIVLLAAGSFLLWSVLRNIRNRSEF